jgi:hypothetical protein
MCVDVDRYKPSKIMLDRCIGLAVLKFCRFSVSGGSSGLIWRKFRPDFFSRSFSATSVLRFSLQDRKFRWSWPEVPVSGTSAQLPGKFRNSEFVAQYSPVRFSQVSGTWPELPATGSSAQVPPLLLLCRNFIKGGSSGPNGRYFRWKPELPAILAGTSGVSGIRPQRSDLKAPPI